MSGDITSRRDDGISVSRFHDGDITVHVNAGATITSSGRAYDDAVRMGGGVTQALNLDSNTLIGGILLVGAESATVNITGAVSITGASHVSGTLHNVDGTLSFDNSNTTDRFSVGHLVGGGTITLNVAFVEDGADTADLITLFGGGTISGGATTINLVGSGNPADLDEGGLRLVDAYYTDHSAGAFTAGTLTIGETTHDFTLTRDASSGDWKLAAVAPLAPVAGCFESEKSDGRFFVCEGAITERQTFTADSDERFVVIDKRLPFTDGASFDVAAGDALQLFGARGITANITADIDSDIVASGTGAQAGNGIFVRHEGASGLGIITGGDISAGVNGIKARHQGDGQIRIYVTGDITGGRNGIYAKHRGERGVIGITIEYQSDITAGRKGIEARHRSDGNISIRTSTGSTITSDWKGIEARHRGERGRVKIEAHGDITAGWKGIEARIVKGAGRISVSSVGTITGGRKGIEARHHGSGDISIRAFKLIRDSRRGIEARHHSTGNIDIHAGGNISAHNLGVYARHNGREGRVSIVVPAGAEIVGTRKQGIRVSAGESNSIEVDVAGSVGGKQAVFLRGGASQRLILRPGFALVGGARGEGATLELTGESEDVLDFDAVEFAGFADLVKSGSGVWELTGEQLEKQGGRSAVVEEGVLRFSDLYFTMNAGSAFSVGENGVLELQGKNILEGGLKNRGSVSFVEGNSASTLEVVGDWDGGGTLTFNADLEAGTANALVIGGDASGSTRVTLRTSGRLDKGKGEAVEVIRVHGSAANDAFSGEGVSGALRYKLIADGAGAWRFHVVGDAPGAPAAEAYAGALAVVAQPASVMERFGEGYWRTEARVGGGSASLVADVSETSSRFGVADIRSDMSENRARAGVLVPVGDVLFGAEMWQGAAQSRVSSALGGGEIDIASHAALLSATWLAPNGFYADAQAQYARFTGALQTGAAALASGNDGTGASASAELGWRLDAPALAGLDALRIAPQAQVTWSRIGFEDFSAPDGLHVSLEDGVTASARLGLAWEGEWRDLAGIGRIHGGINLHEPLDGTTIVNVSGISFANEQRDLGLDATLGFGYEWADGYSLNVETSASRQGESEEYGINLGARIRF